MRDAETALGLSPSAHRFVYGPLRDGCVIRVLSVVNDFARVSAAHLRWLTAGAARDPAARRTRAHDAAPRAIVCENGAEFTRQAFDQWAHNRGITLHFIRPGKPSENCYVESFNGRLSDECLNESSFVNLADAQRTIEAWRIEYNEARPHSGLALRTPAEFAETTCCSHLLPSPIDRNSWIKNRGHVN